MNQFSYFTNLQGSQTPCDRHPQRYQFSYFTNLQGSQTPPLLIAKLLGLVTLLIYKVLKLALWRTFCRWV